MKRCGRGMIKFSQRNYADVKKRLEGAQWKRTGGSKRRKETAVKTAEINSWLVDVRDLG